MVLVSEEMQRKIARNFHERGCCISDGRNIEAIIVHVCNEEEIRNSNCELCWMFLA